jgi:hypothetical protein
MFNAFLISLALGSVYSPSRVAFVAGNIQPDHGKVITLPQTKTGYYYTVNVRGLNAGGDIDCYVLQHVQPSYGDSRGYGIKYSDESSANKCSFGFYATSNETYKLWLMNNGNVDDAFDVSVSQ